MKSLKINSMSLPLSILVTSGGTKEPIDRVRHISNISQGLTGSSIAEELLLQGFRVTFLYAKKSYLPPIGEKDKKNGNFEAFPFETFSDFKKILTHLLSKNSYQSIVHSAALSDFSVQSIQQGEEVFNPRKDRKVPSQDGDLVLYLRKNEKLLLRLKEISQRNQKKVSYLPNLGKPPFIFGFKLTYGLKAKGRVELVREILKTEKVDFVVHNDFCEIEQIKKKINFLKDYKGLKQKKAWNGKDSSEVDKKGFSEGSEALDRGIHIFRLYRKNHLNKPLIFLSKRSLAKGITKLVLGLQRSF